MRIMIVDDHADMRRTIRSVAEHALPGAAELIEFGAGEEAIRHAAQHRPDLLLIDIQLRTMTGFDVMERIRAVHAGLPVIFITSHNASAYRVKARTMHADGFIIKDRLNELEPLLQYFQSHSQGGSRP